MMYYLNLFFLIFVVFSTTVSSKECSSLKSNSKLFCYYEKITDVDDCRCTYIILPANSDVKAIERLGKNANGAKFLVTVHEFNEGLVNLLKSNKIDGLEINLRKLDSKNDINDFISTIKSKLDSNLFVALSVPAKTEIIAKYFDFKQLSKNVDAFILQTAFLGASQNVTFHTSRLSGMWDMQNTDSVLDLISGLGAPLQKVIISAPVQGFQFKLQNDEYTAPGSPALELKSITRKELCEKMGNGANWTLERDQDQTGPYIFSNDEWIAFEDPMSIDIKTKYVRVRGLAGLALKDLSQDDKTKCESSLLEAAYEGISKQARAPRGAILHSLEREILERSTRQVQSVKESPFRISRVIDTEGHIHVVRQDTRTEFECSRQGYFVHPRSCNRFYRCVKFDQLVDDYNVFEFDCPEGLVFDEKVEVCVWPGSLPHASACSGSSEIAPVPKQRFVCPSEPGYYADPENCRWFFACLDHGQSSMEAYEFRCPYGLVFDQDKLLCEWPWIVKCGAGFGIIKTDYYGGSTNTIETYDGLGTLHAVSLGGVSGTLQSVPSKIYSNVGFSGSQFAANNALNKDGYLYQNSAEYLNQQSLDAAKRLGLSVKATQSLQNAGLINTVHLNGYNSDINNFQNGQFALNSGVKYTQTPIAFGSKISNLGNLGFVSTLQENNQNNYDQLKINQLYNENPYLIQNGAYQTSLKESQNLNEYKPKSNYQVKTAGLQAFATKSTLNANQGIQGNINIVAGGTSGVDGIQIYNNGEELSSSTVQGYNTADIKTTYQSTTPIPITGSSVVTSVPLPSISTVKSFEKYNGGVVANIPQLQYSVNPYAGNVFLNSLSNKKYGYGEFNSGNSYNYAAKINSLPYITYKKPDYSLNGYASLNQQNQLAGSAYSYSNKLSQNNQGYVSINSPTTGSTTPTSIYSGVSLSSTPIISSTLKPIVVQQPQVYVSSTPSTFNIGVDNNPAISSYSFTKQDSSLDYNYPKSETKQIYVSTTPASLNIPTQQVFEQQQITLKQGNAGIAYSSDNSGYDYPKPSIKFEEKPQVFSSTAATLVQPIQKVVVQQKSDFGQISSHNFDTKYDFGYNPSIKIESTPQVYVSTPASIPLNPVTVEQQKIVVQQPVKSQTTYNYQAQNNVGYSYPQPSVFVDKKPQVFISSSTITPTVNPVTIEQQKLLVQQPVNSITYTSSNQENNGYSYPKPAIKFEEGPKTFISSTPSTLKLTEETQVYVQPKQSTVYVSSTPATFVQPVKTNVVVQEYAKPAISSYSFTKKESNYGYTYPKPVIPFEEKPKVYVSSTPAVPVKPLVIEQPKVYVKETVKPALTYTYQNQDNLGYYYPKPAIKIDQPKVYVSSTPLPIVPKPQVYVQQYKPAVSTYTFNKLINSVGYSYPKPALAFEEKPQITYNVPSQVVYQKPIQPVGVNFYQKPLTIPKPLLVQQPVQELPKLVVQQPQVISTIPFVQQKSSYNYNNQEVKTGYQYTKPINVVEEKIQYQQPILSYKTPVVTYKQVPQVVVQQPQFVSSTPSSNFVEHKVSSYNYNNQEVKTSQYKPLTIVEEKQYQQPIIYEQKPALYNTQLYNIQQKSEQALNLQKQAESFIGQDIYIPQVTTPQTYVKPVVLQPQGFSKTYVQPVSTYNYKTIVGQTVKTVIPVTTVRPKVITSSTYSTPVIQQNVEFKGYDYPKPQINFVEESKYVTYNKVPVQEIPIVPKKAYVTYQSTPKPLIVENYSTGTPVVQQKVEVKGYDYPKPQINFAEEPKYVTYENKVPVQVPIVPQKAYVTYQSTPKPIVVEDYSAPTPVVKQNVEYKGYDYPKPQINFVEEPKYVSYENKVPVQEVPIVPKKAYVTYQSTPTPIVVEDYSAPPTQNIRLQNVNENRYYQKQNVLKLQFGKTYFAKTPAPTYQTTLASVVQQKLQPTQEPFYYYDSRLSTTPPQIVNKEIVYTTETPVIEFKSVTRPTIIKTEQPFRQEVYQYDSRLSTTPETVTSRPTIDYSYNADNLELKKEYIAIEKKPSTYLPPTSTIQVTTEPIYSTYLPPTTETNPPVTYTSRPRVRITTQPSKEYLPVRNRVRITTTEPNLEYQPVRNKARITTTTERVTVPSREYLPTPTVGATIVENYENFNLLKKPAKVIKIVRPVVKTVIKENNFHPLLAAKLGAQCTCVSNTVKLRKEPLRIEVEDEDYVESDNEGTVVDNYEFDSQKDDVVEITPTPLIDLRSSTARALKNSRGKSRGRFYVVSDKNDVQIVSRKKISPIVVEDDDETSDQDIVRAVKTGLKLVKQAAREGARQGTEEALTGLSREEKLLGVECQRAGLFRHPTQCNKFYSCKWDCTKNQYKLHVFNCPVHLTFDGNLGACNWPSQGPACLENTLLPNDS